MDLQSASPAFGFASFIYGTLRPILFGYKARGLVAVATAVGGTLASLDVTPGSLLWVLRIGVASVSLGGVIAALAIATRNWNAHHGTGAKRAFEFGAITASVWPGNFHNLETVIRFADRAGAPSLIRRRENVQTGENSVTLNLEISVGDEGGRPGHSR